MNSELLLRSMEHPCIEASTGPCQSRLSRQVLSHEKMRECSLVASIFQTCDQSASCILSPTGPCMHVQLLIEMLYTRDMQDIVQVAFRVTDV